MGGVLVATNGAGKSTTEFSIDRQQNAQSQPHETIALVFMYAIPPYIEHIILINSVSNTPKYIPLRTQISKYSIYTIIIITIEFTLQIKSNNVSNRFCVLAENDERDFFTSVRLIALK